MSWLGNIFGVGTGNNNGAFQATGTNQANLNTAQNGVQSGLSEQQGLVNAVTAQNGLANQSQVYNQMQGLAGQLQTQANGGGYNPATAQLNATTGQNVQNQAALMASSRGASANAGLIARQAAQQGAATQQQAVGQAATLSAQQALAATNALQSQQANLANLATTQAGQQASAVQGFGQLAEGNQGQQFGLQANQNTVNSSLAQSNQKAGAGLIGGVLGGVGQASLAHGGVVQKYADGGKVNTVVVPGGDPNSPRSSAGKYLSGMTDQPQQNASQQPSGDPFRGTGEGINKFLKKGADALFSSSGKTVETTASPSTKWSDQDWYDYANNKSGLPTDAETYGNLQSLPDATGGATAGGTVGGSVGAAADGAEAAESAAAAEGGADAAGGDELLELLAYGGEIADYSGDGSAGPQDKKGAITSVISDVMSNFSKGGEVNAMVSPGEEYLTPNKAQKVAAGKASPLAGKRIPGKAKVNGDNLKNDTVPKKLQPGGVVIPRSIMQSDDAAEKAKKFVQAVLSRQMKRRAA